MASFLAIPLHTIHLPPSTVKKILVLKPPDRFPLHFILRFRLCVSPHSRSDQSRLRPAVLAGERKVRADGRGKNNLHDLDAQ